MGVRCAHQHLPWGSSARSSRRHGELSSRARTATTKGVSTRSCNNKHAHKFSPLHDSDAQQHIPRLLPAPFVFREDGDTVVSTTNSKHGRCGVSLPHWPPIYREHRVFIGHRYAAARQPTRFGAGRWWRRRRIIIVTVVDVHGGSGAGTGC